jgi:single-strand DNA-binding protein
LGQPGRNRYRIGRRVGLGEHRRPRQEGNWASERLTDFYQVVCFGSLAENVARSFTKGMGAVVAGKGEVEHWVDDTGQPRTDKRIVADAVGPDLRWATAVVDKVKSTKAGGSQSPGFQEEEPF